MTGMRDPQSGRQFRDEELDWVADHLSELRQGVAERRFRNQTLWAGLAIGLAVHVVAYLLKSSGAGDLIGVVVDLLYALGYALWTGVVVVAMVEVIPGAKERQISRALDAYEAALRSRSRANEPARIPPETRSQG